MTWAFLIDAHLPRALANALAKEGYRASHAFDLGMMDCDDTVMWAVATNRSFVIVSKDSDFADMAIRDSAGPPVVWLRIGNTRKLDAAILAKIRVAQPR